MSAGAIPTCNFHDELWRRYAATAAMPCRLLEESLPSFLLQIVGRCGVGIIEERCVRVPAPRAGKPIVLGNAIHLRCEDQ